jgi:hypothetical protein
MGFYKGPSPRHNAYDRWVNILWSPDSSGFVLNDWYGDDQADAYLYRVNDLAHPTDIGDRLQHSMTDKLDKQSIEDNYAVHTYVFASRWVSPKVAEVKIAGDYFSKPDCHGHFRSFTVYYLWDLQNKTFKRIKRVPEFDVEPFVIHSSISQERTKASLERSFR